MRSIIKRRPFHSLFAWPAFDAFFDSVNDSLDAIEEDEDDEKIESVTDKEAVKEIHFRLPGLKKEDIDISIKDGLLTVHSKCDEKEERTLKNLFFKSIRTNEFTKQVSLGDMFDEDKIEASLEDGILTIKLPYDLKKLSETKDNSKKILIK